ncbi:MAG: peptide-methionine (S)-S-oxide reductase MsrA, partial [Candidatus Omnitrophica bacterium]|nr:peptide-methionine (S)-S-oxide reductase MsrA [Candidatus Omnitrophota bacterium]
MKQLLIFITICALCVSCADEEGRVNNGDLKKATFAGGCFWCMEPPYELLDGVKDVRAGYTGGRVADPGYDEVSAGRTGHLEAVEVLYDPSRVSYEQLLEVFWANIDPTDAGGQFADRGSQYATAVFYHDQEQKEAAERAIEELEASGMYDEPVATRVLPAGPFYPAEEYHQDYYKKNPIRYKSYKKGSGRAGYIQQKREAGKDEPEDAAASSVSDKEERLSRLTPLQRKVTQRAGTEPPFRNKYWDNKREGIYVDIVSGEPLFSSTHKFESGTGWPSFTRPLEEDNIV